MASRFINGAKYAVSTSLAAAVAVSAISNADPAVATTATPPTTGSVVVLKSGWTTINESVARVGVTTANTFQLEGVDTTSTARFPPGEGAGVYQVAGDFVSLSQVRDVQVTGGEQQYYQFQYVEDESGQQRQSPTFKNAQTMTIVMDYDPDLPWYQTLIDLDRLKEPVVLRETLPNEDVIYYYGLISFNKSPTKAINENMQVSASLSQQTDSIRYGA